MFARFSEILRKKQNGEIKATYRILQFKNITGGPIDRVYIYNIEMLRWFITTCMNNTERDLVANCPLYTRNLQYFKIISRRTGQRNEHKSSGKNITDVITIIYIYSYFSHHRTHEMYRYTTADVCFTCN